MKKIFILIMVTITISFVFGANEDIFDYEKTTVVATVNEQEITSDELLGLVLPNFVKISQSISEIDPVFSEIIQTSDEGKELLRKYETKILNDYIEKVLMIQYGKDLGLTLNKSEIKERVNESITKTINEAGISMEDAELYYILKGYVGGIEMYMDVITNRLLYEDMENSIKSAITNVASVSEEEANEYYKTNITSYTTGSDSAILNLVQFDSFAEAYSSWKAISNEATPLEIMSEMENFSTNELTREQIGKKNPDLFQKIKDIQKGLIQSVISYADKFAVIYVQDFIPAGVSDFENSKTEIIDLLLNEKKDLLWNAWYDTYFVPFKENSNIYINLGDE